MAQRDKNRKQELEQGYGRRQGGTLQFFSVRRVREMVDCSNGVPGVKEVNPLSRPTARKVL